MDASFTEIGRAIKQVQWRHHRAADSHLRAHGSTIMQWDALRAIDREPGATSRRLAAETFQSEQSFGVMAARMERNGLIEREQGTGRSIHHRITESGRRLLAIGNGYSADILGASLSVLTATERAQLLSLLQRVRDSPDFQTGSHGPRDTDSANS